MKKLHLGGGKRYIPGFTHIDLDDFPHIDYKQDISKLDMFEDNTVDYIYCCHALEYLDREQAKEALKEWHRVLKEGGILRVAVPNFETIIRVYQKYKDIEHRGILGPIYGQMTINVHPYCYNPRIDERTIFHKTMYDFKSLKKLLEKVGFKNIHQYDWRETEHADVDDFSSAYIPHLDKEHGILISLNIEAES